MFGLIRLAFSLIGFLFCVLVAVYFFRAHFVLGLVQTTLEKSTGRQLIASTPRMSGWTPLFFSLDRAVLLNPPQFPKSDFIVLRSVEVKFRDPSWPTILDVEKISLDIEQMTIVRHADGSLNFQVPEEGQELIPLLQIDEVSVSIRSVFYYDYTSSENPVPKFFLLNQKSTYNSVKSHRQLAKIILDPLKQILDNYLTGTDDRANTTARH